MKNCFEKPIAIKESHCGALEVLKKVHSSPVVTPDEFGVVESYEYKPLGNLSDDNRDCSARFQHE